MKLTLSSISRDVLFAALIIGVAVFAGCTPTEEAPPAEDTPAGTATAGSPAVSDAPTASAAPASVTGVVTFDGPRPERTVLDVRQDKFCQDHHATNPLLSNIEVVNENGQVQWCFVYIKNPPAGDYPIPQEKAKLDQVNCEYIPHVQGIIAGQEIEIVNSDATTHNVRSFGRKNPPFNNSQPAGAAPRIKTFKKPEEAIKMKCDVHPWMQSYIFSMEHPYFAVTDENGAFTIPNVPQGTYTLVSWHERYGEQETEITVGADGATANFAYKPS